MPSLISHLIKELKADKTWPKADHNTGNLGHGHVMDNFQSSVGLLNLRNTISNDVIMMGSDVGYLPSFEFPNLGDEVPCVTAENGYRLLVDSTSSRIRTNWKGRKKTNGVKGQWTMEEDRMLIQLVEQYGVRKWSHIAQMLPGRIGKQCRERWHNHLRPDIKKDTWSEEEDKVLIQAHREIGNKWAEIAKRLPGRTENSIKNHWNATKRRQFSKRKCRSKYPRDGAAVKAADNKSSSIKQPQGLDIGPSTDRLVPEYECDEVHEFSFDEKLLQESCSIELLLDQIPSTAAMADEKSFQMGDMGAVKKEMDLPPEEVWLKINTDGRAVVAVNVLRLEMCAGVLLGTVAACISTPPSVRLRHVRRTANRAADHMAKLAGAVGQMRVFCSAAWFDLEYS
ncbi:hypothetical protein GOBAR_DD30947 [Gossypium barbadense]|nr:hypothetical protein GOBAR_DD30947 [Gossypium barbadense]